MKRVQSGLKYINVGFGYSELTINLMRTFIFENLPHRKQTHRNHIAREYQNLCVIYVSMVLCGEITPKTHVNLMLFGS